MDRLSEDIIQNEQFLFLVEDIPYRGRIIRLISLEHEPPVDDREAVYLPADWQQKVKSNLKGASVLFVEWFPPELEQTLYKTPILGPANQAFVESQILPVYGEIANIAKEIGLDIAVADIANRSIHSVYEFYALSYYALAGLTQDPKFRPYERTMTEKEKVIPFPVDARRLITAKAMMQEVERRNKGSVLPIITPFAHVTE